MHDDEVKAWEYNTLKNLTLTESILKRQVIDENTTKKQ
jgi:hypothetical protein